MYQQKQIKQHNIMETQLSTKDLTTQLSKLSEIAIMVCDTPAWDSIQTAIIELKKCINEKTGTRHYNV